MISPAEARPRSIQLIRPKRGGTRGFSLLELMVAMAVFLVVAGAAFSLFDSQAKMVTHQQNLSGVNIGLRSALTQIEIDLANAGQNLLASANGATAFSLGVALQNNVPAAQGGTAAACTPTAGTWAYPTPSACYDALTIPTLPPALQQCHVLTIQDPGQSYDSLGSSSTMFADDANTPGNGLGSDIKKPCFQDGDEILVIQIPSGQVPGEPGSGNTLYQCGNAKYDYCMDVITLTKDAALNAGNTRIKLEHNPTGASNNSSNDPMQIFYAIGVTNDSNALGQACTTPETDCFTNGAFIVDLGTALNTITYSVQPSASNAADPQLIRCYNGTCAPVMDQVVGFKVGAALWSSASKGDTDIANYFFNAANYCSDQIGSADCSSNPKANDPYDFTLVRSVRVSLIARTIPSQDLALSNFTNNFDGGPYLVQQGSVVVDLRNLSNYDWGY